MTDETWSAGREVVLFQVRPHIKGHAVSVWAGDELDPCYLTPGEARRAAAEWPVILLRLADEAAKEQQT